MALITRKCKFSPGWVINHKNHGYRGVIFDVDESFQADDDWSDGLNPRADKNQPWYHVLVDGEDHSTYVAEESLIEDKSDDPIDHPLISDYFEHFKNGAYQRPWDA